MGRQFSSTQLSRVRTTDRKIAGADLEDVYAPASTIPGLSSQITSLASDVAAVRAIADAAVTPGVLADALLPLAAKAELPSYLFHRETFTWGATPPDGNRVTLAHVPVALSLSVFHGAVAEAGFSLSGADVVFDAPAAEDVVTTFLYHYEA